MKSVAKIGSAVIGAVLLPFFFGWQLLQSRLFPIRFRGKRIILLYSQVGWDEVWQRPHEYAMRASLRYPVVYCAPIQPHTLLAGFRWKPLCFISREERQLLVLSPLIFSGHYKSRVINSINCWLVARYLELWLPSQAQVHLLTNTPFSLPVIEHLFFRQSDRSKRLHQLVYDLIDDFTAFEWSPPFARDLHRRLSEISDKITTGTAALAQTEVRAVYIPSGVDYDLFATPATVPEDIACLPAPILGYFGTISDRLDLEVITVLAEHFPEGSIVLIGPSHLPLQRLPHRRNIHYLGPRSHSDLPGYAQSFSVALIPFKKTKATVVLNPVKTLEYMASGLPVVATRLPDLELQYQDVILFADTPAEFAERVRQILLAPDPQQIERGRSLARSSSWVTMAEKIDEVLFPDSKAGNTHISETRQS